MKRIFRIALTALAALTAAVAMTATPANAPLGSMTASLSIQPHGTSYYSSALGSMRRT